MTMIEEIAKRVVAGASFFHSPPSSHALVIHVLDTVGAWIAGRATLEGHHLARLRNRSYEAPAPLTFCPLDTVALRVATARLTEVDDVHMPSCTTPGSVVIMTALSLAAAGFRNRGETDLFVDALHTGYEVLTRFGEAVSGPEILHRGIWPTYMLAPITTAAVTAKLLNLDRERTAHALAIALTVASGRPGGSVSGGVIGSVGTSARWLFVGLAAKAGCTAALSAAAGFNGDHTLLDGEWPSRSHGIQLSSELLRNFFEGRPAVQSTSIKPYCAAKQAIAAINGFELLLKQGIPLHALTKVRVKVPTSHADMVGHLDFGMSRLSRITSCGYNLALAAFRPDDLLDIGRAEAVADAAVTEFARKVEVVPDDQLELQCPRQFPATLDLFVDEKIVASITVSDAWGDPAMPFDLASARRKFRRLAREVISEDEAARIEQYCIDLLDNPMSRRELSLALAAIDSAHAAKAAADLGHAAEGQGSGTARIEELENEAHG